MGTAESLDTPDGNGSRPPEAAQEGVSIVCKVPADCAERLAAAAACGVPGARVTFWPDADPGPGPHHALVYDSAEGVADLPNLRLIVAITAGVERLLGSRTLPPGVPLVRGVSVGMTQHMTEYVVHHVLAHHRQARAYREQQARHEWRELPQPPAAERRVGILGLGVLGTASAVALAALGFSVRGWSRAPKAVPGVESLAGAEGLTRILESSDILVNLLPLTDETKGLLDDRMLARLPHGSCLINVSRSGVIVEGALLAALDEGRISEATLDVFDAEPLPPEHALWRHPRVTVTPHCAGPSDMEEVAFILADSIRRLDEGRPLRNRVDIDAGY